MKKSAVLTVLLVVVLLVIPTYAGKPQPQTELVEVVNPIPLPVTVTDEDGEQVYGKVMAWSQSPPEKVAWSWGDGTETTVTARKKLKIFDATFRTMQDTANIIFTVSDAADKVIYRTKPKELYFIQLNFWRPIVVDAGGYVQLKSTQALQTRKQKPACEENS